MLKKIFLRRSGGHDPAKRLLDISLSLLLLCLLAPIMALIAFLVKADSEGPAIYTQKRVGVNRRRPGDRRGGPRCRCAGGNGSALCGRRGKRAFGSHFSVLKFRSMVANAEADGRPVWCRTSDPRVTRVGAYLRASHLDELPQLINVFKGEMSLVGPRPERPEFVAQLARIVPRYEERLALRPGLTGLAQIRHRADLVVGDVRKKVRYDLLYAKRASWITDLKILWDTALFVVRQMTRNRAPQGPRAEEPTTV